MAMPLEFVALNIHKYTKFILKTQPKTDCINSLNLLGPLVSLDTRRIPRQRVELSAVRGDHAWCDIRSEGTDVKQVVSSR